MLIAAGACLVLCACSEPPSRIDQIQKRGELRVITRNGPTTYFIDGGGETGFEFEMAQRFANSLGVRLHMITAGNNDQVIEALRKGRADIGAAGLSPRLFTANDIEFGPSYQWITNQVVYRNGMRRPRSLDDIYPEKLHVAIGTLPGHFIDTLKQEHVNLNFAFSEETDSMALLALIETGAIRYSVAASNEIAHARQINPEIRSAFNVTEPLPLAWAMKRHRDRALFDAVTEFHQALQASTALSQLLEYFYGQVESFDYVDSRKFVDRVRNRLPKYRTLFEKTAPEFDFDWRLLAAMSYQESHWNPKARSPTGVRGLMMLTLSTAHRLGIKDRLDPQQSVRGGARYLNELYMRLPARIKDPDRTWMALAAYNVGLGHLEDARILTERQSGDPDRWADVRKRLPLLSQKRWYAKTKHGYARGHEPVRFVDRIRRYRNALVQLTQPDILPGQPTIDALLIDSPVL